MSSLIAGSSCYIPTILYYDKAALEELVATCEGENRKAKEQCKFTFSNWLGLIIQLGCHYIVAISLELLKS